MRSEQELGWWQKEGRTPSGFLSEANVFGGWSPIGAERWVLPLVSSGLTSQAEDMKNTRPRALCCSPWWNPPVGRSALWSSYYQKLLLASLWELQVLAIQNALSRVICCICYQGISDGKSALLSNLAIENSFHRISHCSIFVSYNFWELVFKPQIDVKKIK